MTQDPFENLDKPVTGILAKVRTGLKIIAWGFFAFALFSVALSVFVLIKGERVQGRVVEIYSHRNTSSSGSRSSTTSYTPVFGFTYMGEERQMSSTFNTSAFSVNDPVEIIVEPFTKIAIANMFQELWLEAILKIAGGLFFYLFATAITKFGPLFQGQRDFH